MEKKCCQCKNYYPLDGFYNDKSQNDKKDRCCKVCKREYWNKNKLRIRERQKEQKKEYYKKNKEKIDLRNKIYYINNKEKLALKSKIYYINNKERKKKTELKYRKKNKEKTLEKKNLRYKNDILFRLKSRIRSTIYLSLNREGYGKKTKTYNILKCDYDFFMQWLNKFASNGNIYGIGNLHLDHVVPISLAQTEDEAYLLNHYSNYQLLSADENLAKSNRYVNPTNLKRVLEHHPNPKKIREIHARL